MKTITFVEYLGILANEIFICSYISFYLVNIHLDVCVHTL